MHPIFSFLVALFTDVKAQTCTSPFAQTNYGVFSGAAAAYCTNAPPARYRSNALLLSRHQAQPGHRLTLTVTAWDTEVGYDFGVAYIATADSAVTTAAACALTGGTPLFAQYAGNVIPSPGSWQSTYGAQIGLCFHSDTNDGIGITYTIAATACPAGSSCPTNSATPAVCSAGTYSASGAVSCSDCQTGRYSPASNQSMCTLCASVRFLCFRLYRGAST